MTDDPDDLGEEDPGYGPAGRPPAPRTQKIPRRPSLPTVDGSLDKFITSAKAEPHAHDVSYFDPDSREASMRQEIDELKKQLAAAEARAAKAQEAASRSASTPVIEEAPAPPPKPRWGSLVAAFAIGGACMFGVNALRPSSDPPASVSRPTIEPIQEPKPPVEPVTKVEQPKPEPPIVEPPVEKPTMKPAGRIANTTPKRAPVTPPKPAEPKPVDPKPADQGLYNPFGNNP